jgi:hypothetical protein
VSLTARHLEANGIPTVVIGSARDIVEQCGVPRFLFSDFPLGNPCGAPYDVEMQRAILEIALGLLESTRFPRTSVQTPFSWPVQDWRRNYMLVDEHNVEELRRMGEERRDRQARRKAEGLVRS